MVQVFCVRDLANQEHVVFKAEKTSYDSCFCLHDNICFYWLRLREDNYLESSSLWFLRNQASHSWSYSVLILRLFTKCKKFSVKTGCYVWIQLLHRIETIHSAKLFHRDIKPQNFVIVGLLIETLIETLSEHWLEIEGNTSREKIVDKYQWIGRKKKYSKCSVKECLSSWRLSSIMSDMKFHERPRCQYLRQLLETGFANQGFDNDDG